MATSNLSLEDRKKIIVLHELGKNISQISQELGITRNTVRFWIRRHGEEGELSDRLRPAPLPMINAESVQRMMHTYAVKPSTTARDFAKEFDCSSTTIRRALHRAGVHHRRPATRITLSPEDKISRVRFAREFRDFDFSYAIFADEKCFRPFQIGRRNLWRINNTLHEPRDEIPNNNSEIISANMWGWMSAAGPGEFVDISGKVNGQSYLELLQELLVPTARVVYPEAEVPQLILFQGNYLIHSARVVQNWLQAQPGIRTVRWPSRSPDLNPIENLWGLMVQRWDNRNENTREALVAHCNEVWESVRGTDLCEVLVSSMRARCDAVIEANGAATKWY